MSKGTTIREALNKWEEKNGMDSTQATVIKLCGINPPIEKMDASIGRLIACEKLSLSSNCIDKISNLTNLRNLKILSLGRNNIKGFSGLETVGDTLEELWISYNQIEKMKGIGALKKLKVLYMANNAVKEMQEFNKLYEVPCLEQLVFVGNPLEEALSAEDKWRDVVAKALPKLKKLDGMVVLRAE